MHTHLVHADVYGALGARRLVSTKHNDDPFRAGAFRFVERMLAKKASKVIAITQALARFQVERVGLPAEKVEVIHYGLDDVPAAWGSNPPADVDPGARVLLAVSRLEPQKGVDVAIRALPEIRRRHPEAVLVVLGEGPQRAELAALARELDVPVLLPGRVPDVAAWLGRADLLVHPARWEGFGLALLEAMLASLPVVATNVSSIPGDRRRRRDGPARRTGRCACAGGGGEPRAGRSEATTASAAGVARWPSSASRRWPTGRSPSTTRRFGHGQGTVPGRALRRHVTKRHVRGTVPRTCQVRAASAPS